MNDALVLPIILPHIEAAKGKYTLSVAGESGSGKSFMSKKIHEQSRRRDTGLDRVES